MRNIKRMSLVAFIALAACGVLEAKTYTTQDYDRSLFGKGEGFLGTEIGIENGFNIGLTAGYQHYFKEAWQFGGFRQGIRGWGNVSYEYRYTNACTSFGCIATTDGNRSVNYNGYRIRAGSDWTLDFNPYDYTVYGMYTGLSIGWVEVFNNNKNRNGVFGIAWNIGASATINNTHRFDLGLEVGPFSIISFRYLYMF